MYEDQRAFTAPPRRHDDRRSPNAPPVVGVVEIQQRYDSAICAVRCQVFPDRVWSLAPAPSPAVVEELCRIEGRWQSVVSPCERAQVTHEAEMLARHVEQRNAPPARAILPAPRTPTEQRFTSMIAQLDDCIYQTYEALSGLLDRWGRDDQIRPFISSRDQLVRKWLAAKDDKERESLVHQAEDLQKNARETLRGCRGLTSYREDFNKQLGSSVSAVTPAVDWKKIVAGLAIAGGVIAGARLLLK
jgi:hypothetical protein